MKILNQLPEQLKWETSPTQLTQTGTFQEVPTTLAPAALPGLRLRTVVAPFDFSNVATELLRRLVAMAETSHMTIHILHVVEPTSGNGDGDEIRVYPGARAAAARMQIEQWVTQNFPRIGGITTTVRVGRAADEIVAHAQSLHADLVVMSAHVGSGKKNVLLRTTTERVVRQSTCPVLVVARDQVPHFLATPDAFPLRTCQRILLPLAMSPHDRDALAYAAAIAQENNAKLYLLHHDAELPPNSLEAVARVNARVAEWLRAELRWPVDYETTVWTNVPLLNAILQEAKVSGIDLIVLPARDCAWFRRHRLWSITDGILRHAPCPVLSVNAGVGTMSLRKEPVRNKPDQG